MKEIKKVATLYVYDHISSTNWGSGGFSNDNELKAFVAPNDDFMTTIFETFQEDGWGDYNEFEERDQDGGFSKWELKKILKLTQEGLEGLGMNLGDFKKNVKTPLEDLSFEDFEIEYFDEAAYNKLFFNAKSIVEPFNDLDNDQLDSLIKALESLKK